MGMCSDFMVPGQKRIRFMEEPSGLLEVDQTQVVGDVDSPEIRVVWLPVGIMATIS